MIEGVVVWVLVIVMPIENGVLLTAAKEVEWRTDCEELAMKARKVYPNIAKHSCTPYELIREDDGDTNRSTEQ